MARELKRYRRKGPRRTTRLLIEALMDEGVLHATLLDVGGGVGAIQHELLKAGASRTTGSEAVPAYLEAAREEARRLGHEDRVSFRLGDFVEVADEIEGADIVTLDRVICCYPDVDSLVGRSLDKARTLYGVVYPRDEWWNKIGLRVINLGLWLVRNPFRLFAHPTETVEGLIRGAGFQPAYYRRTPSWQVAVYRR